MIRLCIFLAFLHVQLGYGIEFKALQTALNDSHPPFHYPLNCVVIPGASQDMDVILCCHGYGGNASLAQIIKSSKVVDQHLVGFDFPDHDILTRGFNQATVTYGSIQEILPALYVLKKIIVSGGADRVSLYGFSAGGGAIVNIIATLNTPVHDASLQKIGIGTAEKKKILDAIQQGIVLLDAPLKSMDEIIACRGYNSENMFLCQRYAANKMRPIDNLSNWQGLKLSVVVFFQNPDEAVCNRDDTLFEQHLKQMNPLGRNVVISKNEGGHCGFHSSLWHANVALTERK